MTDWLTWKHRPSVVDMETPANVLITGGSRGIGFAFARRYLAQGARVLVTGRSAPDLERAAAAAPGLETTVSDLGAPADREALARLVSAAMPGLDLLVHNAGIQRRIALAADTSPWTDRASEIGINLAGPVHLSHLLIPVMLAHRRPATVVTVTSGGAFVPQPFAPLYSATKAALHSYTVNLRFSLAATPVTVVEVIPPAVATGLSGLENPHGVAVDEFADAVVAGIAAGRRVVGYGPTAEPAFTARLQAEDDAFTAASARFPVATYAGQA